MKVLKRLQQYHKTSAKTNSTSLLRDTHHAQIWPFIFVCTAILRLWAYQVFKYTEVVAQRNSFFTISLYMYFWSRIKLKWYTQIFDELKAWRYMVDTNMFNIGLLPLFIQEWQATSLLTPWWKVTSWTPITKLYITQATMNDIALYEFVNESWQSIYLKRFLNRMP